MSVQFFRAYACASDTAYVRMDLAFPRVEFPLYASPQRGRGEADHHHLESRLNMAGTGSFSAAAVANDALTFRRQGTVGGVAMW